MSASASSTVAGSSTTVTLSVPHGCQGSPTTRIAIQIPEGINAVTPTRNAFYTLAKVPQKLETPITDAHGNQLTERVAQVVYTATTALPEGQRDTFELSLTLPAADTETTLHFPTVQTCEVGEVAWIQVPAAGQNPHSLDHPAPAVTLSTDTGTATALLVARFSGLALISVVVLTASGVLMASVVTGDLTSAPQTTYGRTLLVKVALVVTAVVLAAWNRFRLVPVVSGQPDRLSALRRLRQVMLGEVVILVLVVAVTGALSQLTPPAHARGRGQPEGR